MHDQGREGRGPGGKEGAFDSLRQNQVQRLWLDGLTEILDNSDGCAEPCLYLMNEATRESVCHWLSKSGELSVHHDELLEFSKTAAQQEVVDLYAYLAGNSERFESEWRQEFESIFSTHAGALPEVCDADQWSEMLHQLVESGDLTKVKTFIAQIGIESWPLFPSEMIEDGIYPIEQEDENGEVPIEKAKRLGHTNLATYLETILARFRP